MHKYTSNHHDQILSYNLSIVFLFTLNLNYSYLKFHNIFIQTIDGGYLLPINFRSQQIMKPDHYSVIIDKYEFINLQTCMKLAPMNFSDFKVGMIHFNTCI